MLATRLRGVGKGGFRLPTLSWESKTYSDFGYNQHSDATQITVHDNGVARIAVYAAASPYTAYFDSASGQWQLASVPWWEHGIPEVLWAGDGVFLAKITGMANIIASFDGIVWHNSGYCVDAYNAMTTGAYDTSVGCGIVSWWYYQTPLYYSFDDLEERTEWPLLGADGTSVPIFQYLTAHKGLFVGVVGGDKSIATASSQSPGTWTTTIPEDANETGYMFLRSIHGKLFVMKRVFDDGVYYVNLCVLNDSATQIMETSLSHVGNLANNNIPNPQNIVWMEDWQAYALFTEEMLYISKDGLQWEGQEQPGLSVVSGDTFRGTIYVPDHGFYIAASGVIHFAPYA